MLAEVIASAFASGLSWSSAHGGREVYCRPPGLKGQQVMAGFEKFLEENPDMAEKPRDAIVCTCHRSTKRETGRICFERQSYLATPSRSTSSSKPLASSFTKPSAKNRGAASRSSRVTRMGT